MARMAVGRSLMMASKESPSIIPSFESVKVPLESFLGLSPSSRVYHTYSRVYHTYLHPACRRGL
jgi:hypothetical protein